MVSLFQLSIFPKCPDGKTIGINISSCEENNILTKWTNYKEIEIKVRSSLGKYPYLMLNSKTKDYCFAVMLSKTNAYFVNLDADLDPLSLWIRI